MNKLKINIFYVTSENAVYICWEKVNGIDYYVIYKNGEELANGNKELIEENDKEDDEKPVDEDDKDKDKEEDKTKFTVFTRPYEFDNDHHTELFRPATRNWLYYIDRDVSKFTKYSYRVFGKGGTSSGDYESSCDVYAE